MKKLMCVALSLCWFSSMAFAAGTVVCSSPSSSGNGSAQVEAGSDKFVKMAFTPKCSANVHMAYEQDAVNFAAAAGSSRGKNVYGGHTGGGGVSATGTICQNGCLASHASEATAALLSAAISGTSAVATTSP